MNNPVYFGILLHDDHDIYGGRRKDLSWYEQQ